MWRVFESKAARKALDRAPEAIERSWDAWVQIVRQSGPAGLRRIMGFHDESLTGEWKGHRSSRLSRDYRVIYRVHGDELEVVAVDVTKHDYRRR
jgi:addiction module RelE/StbE family toxin